MRAVSVAALISVAAGQAASSATITGLSTAMQGCIQGLVAPLQSRSDCSVVAQSLASIFTSNNTDLRPFCGSSCFAMMRNAYVGLGVCMRNYKPTLVANLRTDGVANPESFADSMIAPYDLYSSYFDFFCLQNERGDFCYPMYFQMSRDISASAATNVSVTDTLCRYYYNGGCCLPSLDAMYSLRANTSFISTGLARLCPPLADFNPPPCVGFGRTATALAVTMSLTGLTCSAYLAQTADFRAQYEAALKLDLAAHGISANFITIDAITDASGVCTVKVVLRAGSDAATNDLKTAASTLNGATLTNSNQVLSTAAGTGSVSALGTASVSTITVKGTADSSTNSGALAGPSMALLAAVLAWVA